MLNSKLKNPEQTQMLEPESSRPYALEKIGFNRWELKLPFEFYVFDLFRIWSLVFRV